MGGVRTTLSFALVGVLFGGGLYGAIGGTASAAQDKSPPSNAVKIEPPPKYVSKPSVATSAVLANKVGSSLPTSRLAREIQWQFGGKTQRGWYIYTSLIQQMI